MDYGMTEALLSLFYLELEEFNQEKQFVEQGRGLKMTNKDLFVTREILNSKNRKTTNGHSRQIFNEIKASMIEEQHKKDRHSTTHKRPKTAQEKIKYQQQFRESRSNSFVRSMDFQIKEIKKISDLFGDACQTKKTIIKPKKMGFSDQVANIRKKMLKHDENCLQQFQRIRREVSRKKENINNCYLGTSKQSLKKVISASQAKSEDINMLTRCLTGGYYDSRDQFGETVNKERFLKAKKKFVTFDTLYEGVKGKRSKNLKQMRPQDVNKVNFLSMVYYLENEKNLKVSEKIALKKTININD